METISTVDSTSSPKISSLANGRVDVVAQLPPTLERRRQLESFRVAPVRSSASHAMILEKVKWRRPPLGSQITDSTLRNIALAWVLTLPAAMMLSGTLYFVFSHVF